jgi:hypothetical protein
MSAKPTADAWRALPADVRRNEIEYQRERARIIRADRRTLGGITLTDDDARLLEAMADALESLEP